MAVATPPRRPHLSRTEAEHLTAQYARLFDWRHHHVLVAGRLRAGYPHGFPSDVLVRGDRLVFVTLARRGRRLLPEQHAWIEALHGVSKVEVLIVGPDDLGELASSLQQPATEASDESP